VTNALAYCRVKKFLVEALNFSLRSFMIKKFYDFSFISFFHDKKVFGADMFISFSDKFQQNFLIELKLDGIYA
jgi:hypothetical protein